MQTQGVKTVKDTMRATIVVKKPREVIKIAQGYKKITPASNTTFPSD